MAIDRNGLTFLFAAYRQGVSFERTAMIGRQNIRFTAKQLAEGASAVGIVITLEEAGELIKRSGGYAEPLLELLGAKDVVSIDFSSYEGATTVHDMNTPIDDAFDERFTVVIDGGSLEHIFNVPVALHNCLRTTAIDGHFLAMSPTNNEPGHGFYQFSPEFYFRALSPDNGFTVEELLIKKVGGVGSWFSLADPLSIKKRLQFVNTYPTCVYVVGRKTDATKPDGLTAQQSDYTAMWDARGGVTSGLVSKMKAFRNRAPGFVVTVSEILISLRRHVLRAPQFRRVDPLRLPIRKR